MKHIKKLALLMIVVLGMSSCGLFNVDVDSTLSGVVDVYVEEDMAKGTADDWYPCGGVALIDAQEDEDVQKYSDNIDEISVNDIVATVEYVSTGDILLQENAVFYITHQEDSVAWTQPEEWPLKEGSTFNFDNLGSSYDDASAIILNAASNEDASVITVGMVGKSSKAGVNFKIKIEFGTVFTASII